MLIYSHVNCAFSPIFALSCTQLSNFKTASNADRDQPVVRVRVRYLAFSLLFTLANTSVSAETLKLATWSIEHLQDGIAKGPNFCTEADIERLASYLKILNADVIAFQEAKSLEAASFYPILDVLSDGPVLDHDIVFIYTTFHITSFL